MSDELGERVGGAVEDQLLGETSRLGIDLPIRDDMRRVDDRGVESRLDTVVEEDAVEYRPRVRRQSERHVGHTEHREHAGQLALDGANALDGLPRRVDPLRLPGGEREGESVEDQLIRCQRELVTGEVVDAARDLDLAFRRPCHALLIDGQGDHARAMVAHRRQHRVAADTSVLQVDAVDNAASRVDLERRLDDVGIGAVDDQRRIDAHLQRLDDGAHLIRLIAAFGDRDAQVERMRATFDLRPRDLQDAVIVVREEQTLDGARPLGIDPLTDEQRRRLLTQVDRVHAARQPRFRVRRHLCPRRRAYVRHQLANVLGS